MSTLLTRDAFREGVFARDGGLCRVCGGEGQDAHHIIERRLWSDGGYYLDNGITLCGNCHLDAEITSLSAQDCRDAAGITTVILPSHMYSDVEYDKWGNPILPDGKRLKGELFWDHSVQKLFKSYKMLDLFVDYVKYPRTWHLPWSPGVGKDDRVLPADCPLLFDPDFDVVMTEKMDGENTTMYRDYIHARSVDSRTHSSRSWVKNLHARIRHDIPEGFRVCGENLYATHSIRYHDLPSYFLIFSIWDGETCLSWKETVEYAELLGIPTVPVFYTGRLLDDKVLTNDIWVPERSRESEGYVLRPEGPFSLGQFKTHVGKYVRANHITSDQHNWLNRDDYGVNQLGVR